MLLRGQLRCLTGAGVLLKAAEVLEIDPPGGVSLRETIFGSPVEREIAELEAARRLAWSSLKSELHQIWLLQPEGE